MGCEGQGARHVPFWTMAEDGAGTVFITRNKGAGAGATGTVGAGSGGGSIPNFFSNLAAHSPHTHNNSFFLGSEAG